MNTNERKSHWENIYQSKALTEVSWYEPTPQTSLSFIERTEVSKDAKIIDIGAGDSFLVDNLLALGYSNITVLDISKAAIDRAKKRLGETATRVNWIVTDITSFDTSERYDLWHDRAAFHFLRDKADIEAYKNHVKNYTRENAKLIIGTFSEDGPLKCSGIEISQYNETSLLSVFQDHWETMENVEVLHSTPFNTEQAFVFALFSKKV